MDADSGSANTTPETPSSATKMRRSPDRLVSKDLQQLVPDHTKLKMETLKHLQHYSLLCSHCGKAIPDIGGMAATVQRPPLRLNRRREEGVWNGVRIPGVSPRSLLLLRCRT